MNLYNILVIILIGILSSSLLLANEVSDYKLSLKHQNELNKTIRQGIKNLRHNESKAITDLRTIESSINKHLQHIMQFDTEITKLQKQQQYIQKTLDKVTKDIQSKQDQLVTRIRFFYKISQQNTIKIIFSKLNQTNAGKLSAWYEYFFTDRIRRIHILKSTIQRKAIIQANLQDKQASIATKITQQKKAIMKLKKYQQNSNSLLSTIRKNLQSNLQLLQQGESDYEALQFMLDKITGTVRKLNITTDSIVPFRYLKGQLNYPSHANFIKSGQSLIFKAQDNSDVITIYSGRVIFSDWMRGYGLLTIVDHGNGYMSLYGRNKILFKDRGEWVNQGEVLAKVGNTGGIVGNGLFFELRYKNKPINPNKWFRRTTTNG